MAANSPPAKYLSVLKKYFGYNEFRPMQWRIIHSVLNERKDNCVVMATGYGKSLCYQFPPVFCNGVGIIISPLISLMQDQVLSLQVKNIPATLLGTAQKDKFTTMEDIRAGKYRLVYATPEWSISDGGARFLKELASSETAKITLVAIDEAHCVSQWGMDFRKSYRRLGALKTSLRGVPFLALTATATPIVQRDICESLNLSLPELTCTSFDRPNLFLSCSVKGTSILSDIKSLFNSQDHVLSRIEKKGSCIIYCPTKKKVDEVANCLLEDGIKCEMYHADLGLSVRERVHKDFVRDKVQVVVATVAFGMGIDKPDVRRIIHYGAPQDIETYYQEIGRAGRDGEQSHCHVFYQQSDFSLAKHFLSTLDHKYRNYKESMTRKIERYLQTDECRRRVIVSHFDPSGKIEDNPQCCDNCLKSETKGNVKSDDSAYDLTNDALLLLKAVRDTGGCYGLQVPIHLLRGSNNKKLPSKYHSSELFGAGGNKPDEYWKLLGGLLLREFLLEDKFVNTGGSFGGFPIKTIKVSGTGYDFINNDNYRTGFALKATPEMRPHLIKLNRSKVIQPGTWLGHMPGDSTDGLHRISLEEVVFDALLKFRVLVATDLDCMPYMILDNHTIQLLAQNPPNTIEELAKIDGITDAKIEKFGAACVNCIESARKSHDAQVVLTSSEGSKKNLKQFSKAKKVMNYDSDEDNEEMISKEPLNESPSTRSDSQHENSKVTDRDIEDSFCDDDIFEGLANDEELISCNKSEITGEIIPSAGSSRPTVQDRLTSEENSELKNTEDQVLEDSFCDDDIFQGLANDEELISSSLHKTVKHQERVSSPEAPPTKRSKTDEVSSYNRCLPPSKTIKIREELVKKNEMKKQTLIKKIKL
uniref:ATP-dependent DNA helicase n=2 Tax=Lygus hesperus TaxID=30085 RepID=A0A0A9XIJ2_LYGHE